MEQLAKLPPHRRNSEFIIMVGLIIIRELITRAWSKKEPESWRGGSMVGRRLRDRKVAGSTGLCATT